MQDVVMPYTPANWYWFDASGRLFSSRVAALVSTTDAAYEAWLAINGAPSPWPKDGTGAQTGAALNAVLSVYGLACGVTP